MMIVQRFRGCSTAALAVVLAACSNVPDGFSSGDFTIIRRVQAPTAEVWDAAREFLRERGDVPEVMILGDGGTLLTGDLRIEVGPGDEEGETRLAVHQSRYVGKDFEERCIAVTDSIVSRLR